MRSRTGHPPGPRRPCRGSQPCRARCRRVRWLRPPLVAQDVPERPGEVEPAHAHGDCDDHDPGCSHDERADGQTHQTSRRAVCPAPSGGRPAATRNALIPMPAKRSDLIPASIRNGIHVVSGSRRNPNAASTACHTTRAKARARRRTAIGGPAEPAPAPGRRPIRTMHRHCRRIPPARSARRRGDERCRK